jgi:hypothetical protein
MCEINEAVEKILLYKANLMKGSLGYNRHIREVLIEHGIISKETGEEEVKILVKVFKMGGIDSMVFDVGAVLALAGQDHLHNWTMKANRAHILRKKFVEE